MTMRLLGVAFVLALLVGPAAAYGADGVLITQRVSSSAAPALTIQVQIEPTRMRTDVAGPNGTTNVTIFDGDRQVLSIVDPARKTYMEMTKADIDRLSAQMQAAVAKLPPEQRAQLEALISGQGGPAAVQLTPTGSDTVGRWMCDRFDLTQNGQKIGEVCHVTAAVLGFTAADFAVMTQMGAFYSGMAPQLANQLPGMTGFGQGGTSAFPVRTVITGLGQTVTTEVVEVARQTFSDSSFAVPAGFTKQDLSPLLGGPAPGR